MVDVCEFKENSRGLIETVFGIGVAKGHDIVGCHQHFFNLPQVDYIMSQSYQKVQPPRAQHVVCEDEVLLRKGT